MKTDALQRKIRAIIEKALEDDQDVVAAWVAHQVIREHPRITGKDKDFWLAVGSREIRGAVQRAVSSYKVKPSMDVADAQLLMPGFRHLQKAYLIAREDEQKVVRTDRMTDQELVEKAGELQVMAAGCVEHASEITRYLARRRQAA
jgi:hypothetical protein